MSWNYTGLFQDWEVAIAKKLVLEFKEKRTCLRWEDFDDLLQEGLTHWFFAKKNYNPDREASQKTFMARIVWNKLTDLAREKEADKRKIARLTVSLDEPLGEDKTAPTLMDKIKAESSINDFSDPIGELHLKIDASIALQKLTLPQRKLCHLLGEERLTVKEASEYLKTSRSTVYDELKRIRAIFEKECLKEYLE